MKVKELTPEKIQKKALKKQKEMIGKNGQKQ